MEKYGETSLWTLIVEHGTQPTIINKVKSVLANGITYNPKEPGEPPTLASRCTTGKEANAITLRDADVSYILRHPAAFERGYNFRYILEIAKLIRRETSKISAWLNATGEPTIKPGHIELLQFIDAKDLTSKEHIETWI